MADESTQRPPEPRTKPRLGRGLSSLIVNSVDLESSGTYRPVHGQPLAGKGRIHHEAELRPGERLRDISIEQIRPNPYQPRHDFDPQELSELAASISSQGILQPLIVADDTTGDGGQPYVLIAGERRLRAARQLSLATVPCVVRTATAQQMLEWALIENIQRRDLNPIERAEAYRSYIDRFGLTQEQAAERLGQPRTTVSNYLRILELEEATRELLAKGTLSFGHAKVLAGLIGQAARQVALARRTAGGQLTVRRLEELVAAGMAEGTDAPPALKRMPAKAAYIRDLEAQLSQAVGTRVAIFPGRAKNTGRVVVEYYSLDDFDRIAAALGAKLQS